MKSKKCVFQQHHNCYPGICSSELKRDESLKWKFQISVILNILEKGNFKGVPQLTPSKTLGILFLFEIGPPKQKHVGVLIQDNSSPLLSSFHYRQVSQNTSHQSGQELKKKRDQEGKYSPFPNSNTCHNHLS